MVPMADLDALLEAIAANPSDDSPRWLAARLYEEQGDPDRSRFIRLQIQLARLTDGVDSPEWLPMVEESERLLAQHRDRWNAPYDRDLFLGHLQYDRGFIELAGVEAHRVLDLTYRRDLFRRLPLRHLDLVHLERRLVPAIVRLPELASMVSLGLDDAGLEDDDVDAFGDARLPGTGGRWRPRSSEWEGRRTRERCGAGR